MCLNNSPYNQHLANGHALITTQAAKQAGSVAAMLERRRLADEYTRDARTLHVKAERAMCPQDLVGMRDIRAAFLMAAGISSRDAADIDDADRYHILHEYVTNVFEPVGDKFVADLVSRFLLACSGALDEKTRKAGTLWVLRRFSQYIVSEFHISGRECHWLAGYDNRWKSLADLHDDSLDHVRAFAWNTDGSPRILAYNHFVGLIRTDEESDGTDEADKEGRPATSDKNVDLCLLNWTPDEYSARTQRLRIVKDAQRYIALGELKGGIDPAGADEHWKTASAHLVRIRRSFLGLQAQPYLFFIGNAIEASMASEIWGMLESGELNNAANMTDERQAVSLVAWLCSL